MHFVWVKVNANANHLVTHPIWVFIIKVNKYFFFPYSNSYWIDPIREVFRNTQPFKIKQSFDSLLLQTILLLLDTTARGPIYDSSGVVLKFYTYCVEEQKTRIRNEKKGRMKEVARALQIIRQNAFVGVKRRKKKRSFSQQEPKLKTTKK